MDLFGLSPVNIVLILGVLLIVFGPDRLPDIAARAGKMVRDLRSYASDVTGEFSGEIAEIQQHFTGMQDELRTVGRDLQATSNDIGATVRDAGSGVAVAPPTAVPTLNEPPPAPTTPEKVVPLNGGPLRTRVDDYKPGS
jgi:sec-independent protein translocase protein TatB